MLLHYFNLSSSALICFAWFVLIQSNQCIPISLKKTTTQQLQQLHINAIVFLFWTTLSFNLTKHIYNDYELGWKTAFFREFRELIKYILKALHHSVTVFYRYNIFVILFKCFQHICTGWLMIF